MKKNILGHVLERENSNILIQTGELPIVPLAESFGFEGTYIAINEESEQLVELNPTPDFKPIYEFKVFNYPDYFLSESKI